MSASQRRKGQQGEREAAAELTDQLGLIVKRRLGQERDGGHVATVTVDHQSRLNILDRGRTERLRDHRTSRRNARRCLRDHRSDRLRRDQTQGH